MPNLTERTKRTLELARGASTELGQAPLSRTHLALGLIREGEGVAATAIRFHGIALDGAATRVIRIAGDGSQAELDEFLAAADRESDDNGHAYVGTEHLLLALLRDGDSPVAQLFAKDGLTYEVARKHIHTILGTTPPSTAAAGSP